MAAELHHRSCGPPVPIRSPRDATEPRGRLALATRTPILPLLLSLSLDLLLVPGCQPEPGPLAPGTCLEDRDCPDRLVCRAAQLGELGRCGCTPSWDGCFTGAQGTDCLCRTEADGTGACFCPAVGTCQTDADCPPGLSCECGGAGAGPGSCGCQPADPGSCPTGMEWLALPGGGGRCSCRREGPGSVQPRPPLAPECPGFQFCGADGRCGCLDEVQCPGRLTCVADESGMGRCRCRGSDDCPTPCTCDVATGLCLAPSGTPGRGASGLCSLTGDDARNSCGGHRPEQPAGALAGAACGVGDWGVWTCQGCEAPLACCLPRARAERCCDPATGLTACAPDPELVCCPPEEELPDACGRCVALAAPAAASSCRQPGDPCATQPVRPFDPAVRCDPPAEPALDGRWVCPATEGNAVCLACPTGQPPNACGGCGPLSPPIGAAPREVELGVTPCLPGGNDPDGRSCPGVVTCNGTQAWQCTPRERNRCGGCGGVAVLLNTAPADRCWTTDPDVQHRPRPATEAGCTCLLDTVAPGPDDCTSAALVFDSLVLASDDLRDGTECGQCGRWQCEQLGGRDWLVCHDPGLNDCSGCGKLRVAVGEATSGEVQPSKPCRAEGLDAGVFSCGPDGMTLFCVSQYENPCHGATLLPSPVGSPCLEQGCGGKWQCVDGETDRIYCAVPADQTRNGCDGCGSLEGPLSCAGGAALVCVATRDRRVCVRDQDQDGHWSCGGQLANSQHLPCELLPDDPAQPAPGEPTDDPDDQDPCEPEILPGDACRGRLGGDCRVAEAACDVVEEQRVGCIDQICERCGQADQHACPGADGCDVGTTPVGEFCRVCGQEDQVCCAEEPRCEGELACLVERCVSCGREGGACCADATCGDWLICEDDECVTCGGSGEPCCSNETCADELWCMPVLDQCW